MKYVITTQDTEQRYATGVVLAVVSAMNPEDAMNLWARQIIDDDFLEMTDLEDVEYRAESRVKLALWILDEYDDEDHDIVIYRVAVDETGEPDTYTVDDLEFEG